jgi:threonine/homoserine/homoserine lactone efflux protein
LRISGPRDNTTMLGRTRRTTRTDVALALVMAGFVYLAWVLACWAAKEAAVGLGTDRNIRGWTFAFVAVFDSWARHIFDILGPLWMLASLYLVIRASRQHRIISWSWLLSTCQAIIAILIAAWAASAHLSTYTRGGGLFARAADWFPAVLTIAVLIWFGTLAWLIYHHFYSRRPQAISDGAKTHAYRR